MLAVYAEIWLMNYMYSVIHICDFIVEHLKNNFVLSGLVHFYCQTSINNYGYLYSDIINYFLLISLLLT